MFQTPKHFSNELFVAYSRPSTSGADCEQLLTQHFSNCSAASITFGSDTDNQAISSKSLGYAVVEFADDEELEKYLGRGVDQEMESGIRLSVRRIASTESELKRKRKLAEDEAERQAEQERGISTLWLCIHKTALIFSCERRGGTNRVLPNAQPSEL